MPHRPTIWLLIGQGSGFNHREVGEFDGRSVDAANEKGQSGRYSRSRSCCENSIFSFQSAVSRSSVRRVPGAMGLHAASRIPRAPVVPRSPTPTVDRSSPEPAAPINTRRCINTKGIPALARALALFVDCAVFRAALTRSAVTQSARDVGQNQWTVPAVRRPFNCRPLSDVYCRRP